MTYGAAPSSSRSALRLTASALIERKAAGGERIAALTAYDYSQAATFDAHGVDVILVGDSLGMVVQGHRTTLAVNVDHMVYHACAVARGIQRALLIADLPFGSFPEPRAAHDSAVRLMSEGRAQMVKVEGAGHVLDSIRYMVDRDIPVCAHLGLTPQSVHRLGGYKVQGKDEATARKLREDARAVVAAGASMLVLECVPAALAAEITRELPIPTIGIGAGPHCDGQVLVCYDMIGLYPGKRPRFVRNFLAGRGSIGEAVAAYVGAVRDASFPNESESF